MPAPPQINIAHYRLTNIDPQSGYDQLPRNLAELAPVRMVKPESPPDLPAWLLARLGRSRYLEFYEPAGLRLEYGVFRRLREAPDEVCHVMYGEDHFNHLAHVRHLPRRRRGTLVATFHQPPERFEEVVRFPDLERRLRALDAAIVLSREQAAYFGTLMAPERVHLVSHGINVEHFRPPESASNGQVRCLAVGSWLRDFGLLDAVIERVNAADPTISFEVLARENQLGAIANAPNTTVRTDVSSEALLASYQAAHLLVHPVLAATASNAVGEAMACGLPVVATRVGGVPDYVPTDSGMLTPPGDPDAMAAAIVELAADSQLRAAMGKAARRAAVALEWGAVARRTLEVYELAASARRRRTRSRARPAPASA